MKFFGSYYKKNLYNLAINPFSYLIAVLIILFSSGYFFILQSFFSDTGSTDLRIFFSAFPYVSIIAVPALTALAGYGKGEQSFPGKVYELPLAKICALLTFVSAALVLTFFVPVCVGVFGDIQMSQVCCGYLGIILYFCATISFSNLLFTALENRGTGIAFVLTSLVLAVFNGSHLIPQYASMPGFMLWFFRSISFAWHFDAAGKGIIDIRDILFYLATIFLFFSLSCIHVESKKGNSSWSFKKYRSLVWITFALLFIDGEVVKLRIDVTPSKLFSVSEYSKVLLKEIDEPMSITYYRSNSLASLYPTVRDVKDFLEEYCSQNRNISFTTVDPAKQNEETNLNNYGIYGQLVDYSKRGESATVAYSAVVISYLDRTEVIPFVLNVSTLEFDLTSRIQAMVWNTQRVVQVMCGNGADPDEDYTYVKPWLESMGFSVIYTSRPSDVYEGFGSISFEQLPAVPLIVLGTCNFNQQDTLALENFVLRGGKAFVCTTPYIVDYANDWTVIPNPDNVIYMLQKYGVYFKESLTADVSNFTLELYSDTTSSGGSASPKTEYLNYPLWPVLLPQTYALKGMTAFWPCAIDLDEDVALDANAELENILVTSSLSWQLEQIDGQYYTNPFYLPQTPEEGSVRGPFSLCSRIRINNGNGGEFVVLGDQYMYTRTMFAYASGTNGDMRNLDFLSDTMLELLDQGAILPLKNRSYINTSLYKVESGDFKNLKVKVLIMVWMVPALVLGAVYGTVSVRRRKFNSVMNLKRGK